MTTGVQAIHLAAPVLALAAMCVVHAVWCRARPHAPVLNALAGSGLVGLGALGLVEAAAVWAGQPIGQMLLAAVLVDAPVFACLSYGYANFVNLGQSSVRVRIYRELLDLPQGVDMASLSADYDEEGMLRVRLARMVAAGDLTESGNVYRLGKPRLLHIARAVFGLKRLVLGRQSEFNP